MQAVLIYAGVLRCALVKAYTFVRSTNANTSAPGHVVLLIGRILMAFSSPRQRNTSRRTCCVIAKAPCLAACAGPKTATPIEAAILEQLRVFCVPYGGNATDGCGAHILGEPVGFTILHA